MIALACRKGPLKSKAQPVGCAFDFRTVVGCVRMIINLTSALDFETPFLAASSSTRLACSCWMKRLRRYWLIRRFRRWGRGRPAARCAARPDQAGLGAAAADRRHRAVPGHRAHPARGRKRRIRRFRISGAGRRHRCRPAHRRMPWLMRRARRGLPGHSNPRRGPVARRRTARPPARAVAACAA